MAPIIRNWLRMNRPERLDLGASVVNRITEGDTVVPPTNADFIAFSARQSALETALTAIKTLEDQLKAARLALPPKMDEWLDSIEQLAKTCDSAAKGAAAEIVATGFQPNSEEAPANPQPLPPVQNLAATAGAEDGELEYTHERIAGARGYERRTTTTVDTAGSWVDRGTITRSSGTLGALPSGSRQWVRVRALGPLGPGPWSDPELQRGERFRRAQ